MNAMIIIGLANCCLLMRTEIAFIYQLHFGSKVTHAVSYLLTFNSLLMAGVLPLALTALSIQLLNLAAQFSYHKYKKNIQECPHIPNLVQPGLLYMGKFLRDSRNISNNEFKRRDVFKFQPVYWFLLVLPYYKKKSTKNT